MEIIGDFIRQYATECSMVGAVGWALFIHERWQMVRSVKLWAQLTDNNTTTLSALKESHTAMREWLRGRLNGGG